MSRVLAIDGGQTGLRARLADDPRIVTVPGVVRLDPDPNASLAVRIEELWLALGEPAVETVSMGLTTMPSTADAARALTSAVAAFTGAATVYAAEDAITAHLGALPGFVGVSLTAGTGIACIGSVPDRGAVRIDGHGVLLGDDGGGFWIGREGIRAVLRLREGRGPVTSLDDAAIAAFGRVRDLATTVHERDDPVLEITMFASAVAEAATEHDAVALGIVAAAAAALADTITTTVTRLDADGHLPLTLGGRVLSTDGPSGVREHLLALLARDRVPVVPMIAIGSPLDGAVTLGIHGIPTAFATEVHVYRREQP